MNKYVFYANDIAINVYARDSVTPEIKSKLKADGFYKLPFDTTAENESVATDKMIAHFKENLQALEEFAKDYAISSTIFATIYALSS